MIIVNEISLTEDEAGAMLGWARRVHGASSLEEAVELFLAQVIESGLRALDPPDAPRICNN